MIPWPKGCPLVKFLDASIRHENGMVGVPKDMVSRNDGRLCYALLVNSR